MSNETYLGIEAAEAEIRMRLVQALHAEHLLKEGEKARALVREITSAEDCPSQILRRLAEADLLTERANNLDRACDEIADSVRGLARARSGVVRRWGSPRAGAGYSDFVQALYEKARDRSGQATVSAALASAEQMVCDGHPASPAAKTSLGVGDLADDVLPELVEHITLRFAAVASDEVESIGLASLAAIQQELPKLGERIADEVRKRGLVDYVVIPVHPFQWDNVICREFSEEISRGTIVLLDTTAQAEPLMSVRTVRLSDKSGAMHIKLALEVQLTGAIRGISAGAVVAPVVSQAIVKLLRLDTGFNPRTREDEPAFSVAEDIAAVRWHADDGLRAHCFGAVLRRDPAAGLENIAENPGSVVAMPVASLIARNPLSARSVVADLLTDLGDTPEVVRQWFERLATVLFVPSISLAARWGIALEPHPQNTVVVLEDGWPVRAIVRDLGGCRVWKDGPLGHGNLASLLQGTALLSISPEQTIDKVIYPLVANLLGNLLTSAELSEAARDDICTRIAEAVADEHHRTAVAHLEVPRDGIQRAYTRVLGKTLPRKRVLAMRLSGAVTEQDYVPEANPLFHPGIGDTEHLRDRVTPWLPWARRETETRIEKAAREEGLDSSDLDVLDDDIANAIENLALVRGQVGRRTCQQNETLWNLARSMAPWQASLAADSYAISGHNVHPLSKLRRGFSLKESAGYGPEAGLAVDLRLCAVRRDLVSLSEGLDIEPFDHHFARHFPEHVEYASDYLRQARVGGDFVLVPLHPWQAHHVIPSAFAEDQRRGDIVVIPMLTLAARPTVSLRTLVPHAPGASGNRPYLKCALDVTLTSTRRSVSQASALGTPRVARLVSRAVQALDAEDGLHPNVSVVPEVAGVAWAGTAESSSTQRRGLSALIRDDVAGYLRDGEIAISASALRGHCGELPRPLVDVPMEFFDRYAYDLVATVFGLMFFHGIALEQHLQNTMVKFDLSAETPEYRGLILRDFSGLRVLENRVRQRHGDEALEAFDARAMTLTEDYDEFMNKGFYAGIFGNLSGIVSELSDIHALPEQELWDRVNAQVRRVLRDSVLPIPKQDVAWIGRDTIRKKGFLTMGIRGEGDVYIDQPNPIASAVKRRG